ncbi:hypothetical protein LTR53_009318 [Teratosphaeriaceae sp. CCFEE 6253]|nr:hypothetical protein LTR53_009318 [Teratosphaeriaceae sp. CCFEE 6253]
MYERAKKKLDADAAESSAEDLGDEDDESDVSDTDADGNGGDAAVEDDEDERDVNDELHVSIDGRSGNSRDTDDALATDIPDEFIPEVDERLPNTDRSTRTIVDNIRKALQLRESMDFARYPSAFQKTWIVTLESYQESDVWTNLSTEAKKHHESLPILLEWLGSQYKPMVHAVQTDNLADAEKETAIVSFELALAAFFDMMLDKQVLPGAARQCTECLADETVTGDMKVKWYSSASRLRRHTAGNTHAPYRRWVRKVELAKLMSPDQLYHCYDGCNKKYTLLKRLQNHIENRTKEILEEIAAGIEPGDNHHSNLKEDGWLSSTFKQVRRTDRESAGAAALATKRNIKQFGHRPLLTELTTTRPAVVDGKASSYAYLGPDQSDCSMLSYPSDLKDGSGSAQQLYDECKQKDLIGKFVSFGGEPAQPSLAEALERRGIPRDAVYGATEDPRKY